MFGVNDMHTIITNMSFLDRFRSEKIREKPSEVVDDPLLLLAFELLHGTILISEISTKFLTATSREGVVK